MNFVSINGKSLSFEDLALHNFIATDLYERNTLAFCSDWLQGKKGFFQIQTSGSTGEPKIIDIEREKMSLSAFMTSKTLHLKPNIDVLVCLNTNYIGGLMMLVRCLENKMNAFVVHPTTDLAATLDKNKFQFAAFVPLQIEKLLEDRDRGLNRLQSIDTIIIGGAPMNQELETKLAVLPNNIYQTFGMTETVSHVALKKVEGRNSTYTALQGVKFSTNQFGCLVVSSGLTDGRPLVTNDIVELISEKEFIWVGRRDNIINSGGIKVSPEKIEEIIAKAFSSFQLSPNFFIYGIPDDRFGEIIALAIEGEPLPKKVETDLLEKIKDDSEKYLFPKLIRYAAKFIYTSTGKIDRLRTKKLL
ncbi:MAG TPA: AMP-binding protein [Cytophagaceae bacterium]|jgi:O-succinylbenzoic acid--CoA ligase